MLLLSRDRRRRSGFALIITLLMLVVITLLLIALFSGASMQVFGAENSATIAREKMLADSAVALVIGQIQQASTQPNQAWISQPGLLRTYAATGTRTPTACYKLYSTGSSTGMIDTSGNLNFLASDIPANWASTPNRYTDLNAPVQSPGSRAIYPILDSAALTNSQNQTAGTQIAGVGSDTGDVTMPVAWLYQLQDGTLGPASNATADNPIVARIAFWTDDDTCKVNVNTAGCGSAWNTPRVNSTNDAAWSTNQPAVGEYSAYPGHPATTSLGSALTNTTPQQLLGFTPRYAWGGSQFGTQPTTPGQAVAPKMDRLYTSIDELCFSASLSSSGERLTNSISASQLETSRFVLTAHSVAPETTLLGEPRVAIWPVADSTTAGAPRITAADTAITNAATVGAGTSNMRSYFFQRGDPQNAKDDFDPAITTSATTSNLQLFNDLMARGSVIQPGYGATFSAKYPGAQWTQILLEITDFIRSLNAVDPSPAPFVPFAPGDVTGAGRAFIVPLTTNYVTSTGTTTLRGFGRCPTLSSLTLVFYITGFNFKDGTYIDYEETPDPTGSSWKANFLPASTKWANVASERVRAFAIPCLYEPGCAYPEVREACDVQITGLNGLNIGAGTNDFGFAATMTSHQLGDALKVTPAERAWGGNEGPEAWRAAAVDAQKTTGTFTYAFSGTSTLKVPITAPTYKAGTGTLSSTGTLTFTQPTPLNFKGVASTVLIRDAKGNTLQTLAVTFPVNSGLPVPLPTAEYGFDGSGNSVAPSYYMTLKNRALLTGTNREFMIQPSDTSRSVEAGTDLRVIAGLSSVPAAMFKSHFSYLNGVAHAHNVRFADGTALYGATGTNTLISSGNYAMATGTVTWTDWSKNAAINYAWPVSPVCSCPSLISNATGVTMLPAHNFKGDWDTGPGISPDGAEINLPDAGTTNAPAAAYFSLSGGYVGAPTQRTPNALVPSPVIFGSLPVRINPTTPASSEPWCTLLFCPSPASSASHPGFGSPPDHLMLDNFWMPAVEPYPISTCMATAGKINLNDQIAPFTYLHRNTALHALLNDLRIPAIPVSSTLTYKAPGTPSTTVFWNQVDENATIAQIENRFAANSADAYLSESEICTVPLVPMGRDAGTVATTKTALDSFWNGNSAPGGLTGDNLRELPYAQLYSRLTTRSNSYTVHLRVQVLKKIRQDPHQNIWNEGVDVVLGEWRGTYEIERYLDPAAKAPIAGSALGPYKYRILSARRFAP